MQIDAAIMEPLKDGLHTIIQLDRCYLLQDREQIDNVGVLHALTDLS